MDGKKHSTKSVKLSFSVENEEYDATFTVFEECNGFDNVENKNGIKINGVIGSRFFMDHR
jgi:hypothetical protein